MLTKSTKMILFLSCLVLAWSTISLAQEVQLVPNEGVRDETPSAAAPGASGGEAFVATGEWQEVKEGQHVPAGLHYRLNLETGRKEAKILQQEDSEPGKKLDLKSLSKALKNLGDKKPSEVELEEAKAERKRRAAELRASARPLETLKASVDEASLSLMSDAQIVAELIREYAKSESGLERKLVILRDLEYYVHQIDVAQSLVDLNGLQLVRSALNDSEASLRELAAHVLGSAAQSNPPVQVAALETGLLHLICRRLPAETEAGVRKKLLYALSALLRNFPAAQKSFLDLGGPDALGSSGEARERVRALTLLLDLIQERQMAEEFGDSGAVKTREEIQTLNEYRNGGRLKRAWMSLKEWLGKPSSKEQDPLSFISVRSRVIGAGWCEAMPELLELPDWDSQEKVLGALQSLREPCAEALSKARHLLSALRQSYESALKEDPENDYVEGLLASVEELLAASAPRSEL